MTNTLNHRVNPSLMTGLTATGSSQSTAFPLTNNTLHEFTKVGFLRQIAVDSSKSYFDTNNTDHYHYYLEDRHELMDISPGTLWSVDRRICRMASKLLALTW